MTVRAIIQTDRMNMSVSVAVVREIGNDELEVWRPSPEAPGGVWVRHDPDTWEEPSFTFPHSVGRAVLAGFEDYLRQQSGYVLTDARKDYLDERKRVDALTDALIKVATSAPSP